MLSLGTWNIEVFICGTMLLFFSHLADQSKERRVGGLVEDGKVMKERKRNEVGKSQDVSQPPLFSPDRSHAHPRLCTALFQFTLRGSSVQVSNCKMPNKSAETRCQEMWRFDEFLHTLNQGFGTVLAHGSLRRTEFLHTLNTSI